MPPPIGCLLLGKTAETCGRRLHGCLRPRRGHRVIRGKGTTKMGFRRHRPASHVAPDDMGFLPWPSDKIQRLPQARLAQYLAAQYMFCHALNIAGSASPHLFLPVYTPGADDVPPSGQRSSTLRLRTAAPGRRPPRDGSRRFQWQYLFATRESSLQAFIAFLRRKRG